MIWKKKPNQSQEQHADVAIKKKKMKEKPLPTAPPPSSSSSSSYSSSSSSTSIFSLSNFLPLSWLSKLKKKKPSTTERSTGSHPKPLFSPPTPLHSKSERISAAEAPRRLSVGDDNSHRVPILTRSARHHSVGGEIDLGLHFRSDLHLIRPNPPPEADRPDSPARHRRRPRRRRADPGILEIQLDQNSIDLKPIASGDRTDEIRRSVKSGRRSFGGKVRPRVRVCSPRLARKRAAEEERRRASSFPNSLDSFAVVKSSRDPSRDFRDSMVEMIRENGIQRPEELEGLLACYLELNSDEHHDVIVKVFMQVWFDLNRKVNRPA